MKCSKCGYENDSDAQFCKKCGNPLKSKSKVKDNRVLIMSATVIICLIILLAAFAFINNNDTSPNSGTKIKTQLTIHPKDIVDEDSDSMISGGDLQVQLKDTENWEPIKGAKVYITLQNVNTDDNQTFECEINDEGIAYVTVEAESGEYVIHGVFKGDDKYYGDTTNPYITILDHYEEIVQSSEPLRDGVDYDSSSLSPEQYEKVMNNPGGHYDLAGNYYAPGEGQ